MQQFTKYIKDFYYREFNAAYLLVILLMLSGFIYLNYWHQLEWRYVAVGRTWFSDFGGYYLLYFIPFASAFLLQLIFYKNCSYLNNHWFWIILFLTPAIFSFRTNFSFHEDIVEKIWQDSELLYWKKCLNWIIRVFVVIIPVFIVWLAKDKSNQPFYGSKKPDSIRPYLLMLFLMLPLLLLACTQKDFLRSYPTANFLNNLSVSGKSWRYPLYQLCYGFDFISIELLFRGFLILALAKICGTHCIIPVACFYCTIHCGKPMAETISSFWGGLLLGIISFNTRSVWGGLIIHLGVAWFMELGGWIGNF